MDGSNLGSRELVVRVSSMWSIVGMTVARQGVEREKNRVASLNICHRYRQYSNWEFTFQMGPSTHLQRVSQLLGYLPLAVIQLILTEIRCLVSGHVIDGRLVPNRKIEHVVHGIPSCRYIPRHLALCQIKHFEGSKPRGQEERS